MIRRAIGAQAVIRDPFTRVQFNTRREIDTIGYPPTTPDGITEPAITGLLNQRGWAITGPWTNDEWDQWVAPIRRVVRVSNR